MEGIEDKGLVLPVAWAVHRALETGDTNYYKIIEPKISLVWDVFNKKYYTKRNPLS